MMEPERIVRAYLAAVDRFIDRFEVRDGRLIAQQVWNDVAEGIMAKS